MGRSPVTALVPATSFAEEDMSRAARCRATFQDASALAAADAGIAVSGADGAIENASATLMRGSLVGIVRTSRLSQATRLSIHKSLFLASIKKKRSTYRARLACSIPSSAHSRFRSKASDSISESDPML